MPELPEVQAHAERLTTGFSGDELDAFRALSFTALKTAVPPPDIAFGHPLIRVRTRAKYLLLEFEPATFVVHLMQGGRLRRDEKQSPKPRGGLARWVFADGRALLLTEAGTEKRAGIWIVDGVPDEHEPLLGLGPDADRVSVDELVRIVSEHSMRLHGLLRDQRIIAGIGRRLANEVCHRAKLSPFANASKLDDDEIARLADAIDACTEDGLAFERDRDDMSSSKERPGAVHNQKGEACPVCGDEVRTVEYSKYTVAYCATCQTGGKILADNTTSKFLK